MIQAENLYLSYGAKPLFESVSFSLQRGERCGLIGRNGCGKSSLFRIITGQETADSGKIFFPKGYKIGHLKQHLHFTEPSVLEETALALAPEDADQIYRVEMVLEGLGFSDEQLEQNPKTLSGGYQLRIQLAKLLISEPDCLLLDEPTNYLDIISIRFLSKFLKEWEKEMILISHDLDFLDATTDHMMTIHRKKSYKIKGKSSDLLSLIADEEERHEKMRLNTEKKKAHLESFITRFGAKASKASQARAKQKTLDKIPSIEKLKSLYNLAFQFNESSFMGKKMVDAVDISFAYSGSQMLIDTLSLTIEKGDRVAIIGKNGFGKSTLLKLLAQQLHPLAGSVSVSPGVSMGYFGQTNIDRLNAEHTIEEEIQLANPKLTLTHVKAICGQMMFSGDLAEKKISVLSGGEKSRVLLGKIIAQPCNILYLDEPTHHLDIESIEALIDAIEDFEGACTIVTHSEWVLRRMPFNKLIICHQNRQEIFLGSYDEFLLKRGWEEQNEPQKPKEAPVKNIKPKSPNVDTVIKKHEKRLEDLEKVLAKNNSLLSTLSHSQAQKAKELIGENNKIQQEIDAIYKNIEDLYQQG